MNLAAEVRRQFRVKTVIVPIVLGAFWDSPSKTIRIARKIGIEDVTGSLQSAVLL